MSLGLGLGLLAYWRRPDVTVYSAKRLHLEGPTIRETVLGGPDAAYRFRYSGLRLVVRSGGKWLLLPAGWTPGNREAALLPDTDDLRVEFTPGREPAGPTTR